MTITPPAPIYRYIPGKDWEVTSVLLDSPRPDGSVAYYQDSLSKTHHDWSFSDEDGRALCRYLLGLVHIRNLELTDGPYLQVVEDDGAVPSGWQIIRAILWVEEYDHVVPVDPEAAAGPDTMRYVGEPTGIPYLDKDLPPTSLTERRTPECWEARYGIEVRDPDGWNRSDPGFWSVPLELVEFMHRSGLSTVYDPGQRGHDRMVEDLRKLGWSG